MSFAGIYAKTSLGVAALIALHGVLALKFDHAVDNFTMVLTIVTLLWLVVSGLAVLFFPEKRSPIWAPLTFIGYVCLNLLFSVLMVTSFGRDESNTVFSKLNRHREPIYYAEMIFAGFFALLNVLLLFRRDSQTPSEMPTLQTMPSAAIDKEVMPSPPQVIEEPQAEQPQEAVIIQVATAIEKATLNFAPESTESVTISVAVKETVEIVAAKPQEAAVEIPAPPANEEVRQEEPAEAKQEEPAEAKQEEPAEAKQEEPAEAKQEEPAEAKQEEPAEAKQEEPAEAKQEEPASDAPKEPAYEGTWDI